MIDDTNLDTPQSDGAGVLGQSPEPSAADFAARYCESMRAKLGAYRPAPPTRSPMDEQMWFNLPVISLWQMANGFQTVVLPNTQRVGIIFQAFNLTRTSANSNNTNISLDTVSSPAPFNYAVALAINNITNTVTGTIDQPESALMNGITGTLGPYSISTTDGYIGLTPVSSAGQIPPALAGVSQTAFALTLSQPRLQVLQSELGPLAQMGWTAFSPENGSEVLVVTEIVLRDWPHSCAPQAPRQQTMEQ
jgi:hypothetical protein